ncbi:MAG: HDOD domain-containing protein [Lysobacteraceae bacterium]
MERVQALKQIADEASRGDLVFPTNTALMLKIRQALDDPNCSVDQAARLIQAEPLLSARSVAVANSVVYNRMGREVVDVKTAVNRIGFATMRSLVMALLTRQMAGAPSSPKQKQMADLLWEHTAHVAALARVIAKRVTRQNPDVAFFAALVHKIGGFYMISRAKDYPALLEVARPMLVVTGEGDEEGQDLDVAVERDLAMAVLRKLEVPAAIVAGIADYWRGMLSIPAESLGDTLLLADYLSPVASPLRYADAASPEEDAIHIDMIAGEALLSEILEESADEVNSLMQSLRI